jgi:hypothetical protein
MFVDLAVEQLALEVQAHDVRQVRFAHSVMDTSTRPTIAKLAATAAFTSVLLVKFAHPLRCLVLQRLNELVALGASVHGPLRVVRHHQALMIPLALSHMLDGALRKVQGVRWR